MKHHTKTQAVRGFLAACGLATSSALAGGSAERVLLIINPASADSMYLGHYYQFARGIPQNNVLYVDPTAIHYDNFIFTNSNADALIGALNNKGISKSIDYIVLASPESFFIGAWGVVSDSCWPVGRFSQTSAYTSVFMRNVVATGNLTSQESNRFYGSSPTTFNGSLSYLSGVPSTGVGARRYLVTASLGYTGPRGNTLSELTALIDRAVACDSARPAGKFYFMNTTDTIRNVRSNQFPAAVAALPAGRGEIINGILPDNRHDCLGIMTGWADPNVEGAPYTLMPGAFCDHLTSWGATFDIADQTKISSWIRKGAVGSSGSVEEPCNYPGKFPAANIHVLLNSGMSMGEAWFRSMQYFPFQSFLLTDPIARPHATIPVVNGNLDPGNYQGSILFTPTASTSLPGASIASFDLYIDGMLQSSILNGAQFRITSGALPDGPHEVRIVAHDNTPVSTVGTWIGTFNSTNWGRSVSLSLPSTGNLSTGFTGNISTSGPGAIREVRLIQNGRVLAAAPSSPAALTVRGRNIGAGKTRIQAEVVYMDNIRSRSQAVLMDIANTAGTPSGQAPVAQSYLKRVQRGSPVVVELPATFDDDVSGATYTILSNPAQSTMGGVMKGYIVLTANANACGTDTLTFRVNTPSGQSNTATVTLVYGSGPGCPADFDGSGSLNANDFQSFINGYASQSLKNDINGDCNLNAADFQAFLDAFAVGCP